MFTEKEILARLQNGEDAETIANELINTLNAANKTYTDQKEAEKKAKQETIQKERDVKKILDAVQAYLKKYYPNYEGITLDEKDAIEVIEIIVNSASEIKNFTNSWFKELEDLLGI